MKKLKSIYNEIKLINKITPEMVINLIYEIIDLGVKPGLNIFINILTKHWLYRIRS